MKLAADLRYNGVMSNPNIIEIVNHPSVVLSTSIKLSEGLRPNRVVLRHFPDQKKFVVHTEVLRIDVQVRERSGRKYDVVVCTSEGFDNGDYYEYGPGFGWTEQDAYEKAKEIFKERAEKNR